LLKTWKKRLNGCKVDAGVHASILAVRSLVLSPTDDISSTLTLAKLCRQSMNYKLCEKVLSYPLVALHANLKDGVVFGFAPHDITLGGISNLQVTAAPAGIGNFEGERAERSGGGGGGGSRKTSMYTRH